MFTSYSAVGTGIGWGTQNLGAVSGSSAPVVGATTPQTCVAFGFTAPATGSLTSVSFYVTSGTGSPTDVRVSVYPDASGSPSITGPIAESLGIATIPNVLNTFTLPNIPIVIGQRYHFVVKNYTPSTTHNIYHQLTGAPILGGSSSLIWGYTRHLTTSGDAGWGTANGGVASFWATMADGLNFGHPYRLNARSLTVPTLIGNNITIPKSLRSFSCIGIQFKYARGGNPTTGNTARIVGMAETAPIPFANVTTTFVTSSFYFPRPVILRGGTTIKAVFVATSVNTTNYYRINEVIVDTTAPALTPYSMTKTVSIDGGVTWTDTPGVFVEMMLLGTHMSDFPDPPINRRQLNAMR